MKPTQISCAPGGLNQIPPEATISGDIRLTPFYPVADVKASSSGGRRHQRRHRFFTHKG